jgi:hypothetical protein
MLKRIVAAAALALLIAVPAQAADQDLDVMDSGQIGFVMPSGNIGCLYTPEGGTDVYQPTGGGPELICERVEPEYVTVILGAEGEPLVIEEPDEQSCCGADNVFAYGNTIELDGFYCISATTGLTCENDDGHGFSMARAGIKLYEPSDAQEEDEDDED